MGLLWPVGIAGSGFLPLDLVGFYDAGVAWTAAQEAAFLGGGREILDSAGVGIRVNVLGFALAEIDWVYPFDRPAKGGHVSFSLNSGF